VLGGVGGCWGVLGVLGGVGGVGGVRQKTKGGAVRRLLYSTLDSASAK